MLKRALVRCVVDFERVRSYGGDGFDRAVKHGLAQDLAAWLVKNAKVIITETDNGKEYTMEVYAEDDGDK